MKARLTIRERPGRQAVAAGGRCRGPLPGSQHPTTGQPARGVDAPIARTVPIAQKVNVTFTVSV